MSITPNTRVPFGTKCRGLKLSACPADYLQWMVDNLKDSDLHEWAIAAKAVLADPTRHVERSVEEQANDFLRKHGIDPKSYETKIAYRGRRK